MSSPKLLNYSPIELGANWQICYKAEYICSLGNSLKASPDNPVEEYSLTDRRENLISDSSRKIKCTEY